MNVVVTGGGTLAPIDDVRAIANVSSGRFAARITEACLQRGATVWHIHTLAAQVPFHRQARFELDAPDLDAELARLQSLQKTYRRHRERLHLRPLKLGTVAEYSTALFSVLASRSIDIAFLAMAASDYVPEPLPGKIDSTAPELAIRCRPAPKVIRNVRDWAPQVYLAGFKLLSGSDEPTLIREAEAACVANRADLTVANDLQTVLAGRHRIHLVRPGQPVESYGPDDDIAAKLVDRAFTWAREAFAGREAIALEE
jgi:phosphopantothenate-cysteine ligase